MPQSPPDIDPEIEALLALERSRSDVDPSLVARIREGAAARIALLLPPVDGEGGGGGESPGSGGGPSASPASSAPTPGGGGLAADADAAGLIDFAQRLAAPSKLAVWGVRVALFASGVASGWVAHETVSPAEPTAQVANREARSQVASESPATGIVDAGLESPLVAESEAPSPSTNGAHVRDVGARPAPVVSAPSEEASAATDGAERDAALAEERLLLEGAQSALARGDVASALAGVSAHRQRFAAGRLAEEREALAVRALARAGRNDEAQLRADAFRARWPHSLLGAVVDRAAPPSRDVGPGTEE